jgi:hypothetical protein
MGFVGNLCCSAACGRFREGVGSRKCASRSYASFLPAIVSSEVVVRDVASYQALLEKADYVDTVNAIRAGMAAHERGEGIDMRESIEAIAKKHGVLLKK